MVGKKEAEHTRWEVTVTGGQNLLGLDLHWDQARLEAARKMQPSVWIHYWGGSRTTSLDEQSRRGNRRRLVTDQRAGDATVQMVIDIDLWGHKEDHEIDEDKEDEVNTTAVVGDKRRTFAQTVPRLRRRVFE